VGFNLKGLIYDKQLEIFTIYFIFYNK